MMMPFDTSRPYRCGLEPGVLQAKIKKALAECPLQLIPLEPPAKGIEVNLTLPPPNRDAQRIADLVGERSVGEAIDTTTDHAWLVVVGYFAQALGLVEALEAAPIPQRQGPLYSPQTKLIEFLVGIVGGIESLQDLNRADRPIARDPTVAEAWAQAIFAHYSGVSRTLEAANEETLGAVIEALRAVSQPFIQAAVVDTLKRQGHLTVDVDLTSREVSPASTDYPEAGFGWMGDDVGKGYQAAVTSLVCERWTRLLLTLQRYAGCVHSADCLQAAVQEVEVLLQVRPRRRVELLQGQRAGLQEQIDQQHRAWEQAQPAQRHLWQRIQAAQTEGRVAQAQVAELETEYQALGRQERPHGRLAKARRNLAAIQKRQQRAWRELDQLQRQADRCQHRLGELQADLMALDERLAHLEADNRAHPNPVSIVLRIDAGFSTGPNLAWLIEMGYTVLTKAHHGGTAQCLRRRLTPQTEWLRVGRNAEAVDMGAYYQNDCPYPLCTMLVRYHLPDQVRHTALLYYGDTPPPPLPRWFAGYNARQTIEAGIKEEKGVFTLKRHLVRSPVGMQLQEQFALFAANLVRWAAAWVKDMLRQANRNFTLALDQVKTLVWTVSRARARWVRNALGHTLIFDDYGPFAGTVVCLSGQVCVQLALPLFNFAPT